jgi:hypothetical protein
MAQPMQKGSSHKEHPAMTKSKFQIVAPKQLESTTGAWRGYGYGPGPYAAERFYARERHEERFAASHPYAFARYERRWGW